MYFSLFMRIISIKTPTFQIKFEAGDLLLFLKNIVFSPQNGCYKTLNDPALYVLKLEYVEHFFIMGNNTRAFRYSKIEYVNKGK